MTSGRKRRLSVAEHIALGKQLITAYNAAGLYMCYFPKTSRAAKAAYRVQNALTTLKSVLDDEVCGLGRDPRNLAIKVYYGPGLMPDPQQTDPNDAFVGWSYAERRYEIERGEAI
jgi:hypothetical protein